jgi:nifR3 family TIM-barrel protein
MKNFWQKIEKPILALAPMAGITDSAFRQICRKYGADVTYSEMASVSALFYKPQKTLDLVRFNKKERPYVVQLFGNNPEHFAVATRIVTKEIRPDGIDINFGCPAKKVFKHGSGCALMPQIELAREIISAVCENTDLPVSIKIRAGIKNKNIDALEFIENVKDLNFSAVMIHGRTYEGGFSGPVDFSICEEVKKIIPEKIVLANGGINTAKDAVEILKNYPLLDGLGIARGAWGKPYLFDQIKKMTAYCHPECRNGVEACLPAGRDLPASTSSKPILQNPTYPNYPFSKIKKIIIKHAELIFADKKDFGLFEIRKHLVWYIKGFPGAAELRQRLVRAQSVKEIKETLK